MNNEDSLRLQEPQFRGTWKSLLGFKKSFVIPGVVQVTGAELVTVVDDE